MRYIQPFGITDPDAGYINGDPTIGRAGSIVPAEAIEDPQRELVALIEASGYTPIADDLSQVFQSVRSQFINYAIAINTGGGDQNAINIVFDPPLADTATPGLPLRIKAAQTTTGPCTLTVDGVQHPLRRGDATELVDQDILAGSIFECTWNDSFWQMQNFRGFGGASGTTNTFITKIPYAADVGTANALSATFSPAITTLVAGDAVEVRLLNNITGAATIVCNALPAKAIVRSNGSPLQSGDAVAGQVMLLIYTAEGNFQFSGILPQAFTGLGTPVGCIILALGDAAVAGTVKLNGALLTRAAHPLLWTYANASNRIVTEADWQNTANRYWTAFSRGDGTTTFRLPDLRGEFMRFWDDGRGIDTSRLLVKQQAAQTGEINGAGTFALSNIIWGAPYDQPGFSPQCVLHNGNNPWNGDISSANFGGGFDLPNSLSGAMNLNLNPGQENRPRNTAITPCIVDG